MIFTLTDTELITLGVWTERGKNKAYREYRKAKQSGDPLTEEYKTKYKEAEELDNKLMAITSELIHQERNRTQGKATEGIYIEILTQNEITKRRGNK